jgi:hypothetical protein
MPGPLLTALLNEQPNRPLFHYKSVNGLYGILGSRSLWASAIQYLNDSLEFKHALGVAREYLYRRDHHWTHPTLLYCRPFTGRICATKRSPSGGDSAIQGPVPRTANYEDQRLGGRVFE